MSYEQTLLIVCPLVFVAGLVDAISGGGGLISLPAYFFARLPIHNAIATNKLSSCMGTTIATAKYIKNKFVPWRLVPLSVVGAFAGSHVGAELALQLTDYYFKIVLLFIVPLVAFYVLKSKNLYEGNEPVIDKKTTVVCAVISFATGIYDGFYGPGTGTFLILLFTVCTHMELTKANGLTKVINLTTNFSALTVFLINGKIMMSLGLIAGCFGIAGNYIGAGMFSDKSDKYTRPFLLLILTVFYVKLVYELFF